MASFFDVADAIVSDIGSLFSGKPLAGAPLQDRIDAATVALNAANKAGDTAMAQTLAQQISDLQAAGSQMINPMVGRLAITENVDMALDGISAPFQSINAFVGESGVKVLFGAAALGLIYYYATSK